jgi:hypothetical protein
LNNLPNSLVWLFCSSNPIVSLDNLPINLKWLVCSKCKISKLSNLPEGLKKLNCSSNNLEQIDNLPLGIIELDIGYNKITCLDYLPNSIKKINCPYNYIENFDNIPNSVEEIDLRQHSKYINPKKNNIYMDNLPSSIKKIYINTYEFGINKFIPIKNINLNKWKLKNSLIDGNYLQSDSIQDVITFSPTSYDEELDLTNYCECCGYYDLKLWGLKYCKELHRNRRCDYCSNFNCVLCYY